jgi:signal transduction histidine kinase
MSPEFVRNELFKPFRTTKADGMGIGVYESSQYVAELGGRLSVDSAIGTGTRVKVFLPHRRSGGEQSLDKREVA